MALITPGYWPATYFAKDYWPTDYWPEYALVVSQIFHTVIKKGRPLMLATVTNKTYISVPMSAKEYIKTVITAKEEK